MPTTPLESTQWPADKGVQKGLASTCDQPRGAVHAPGRQWDQRESSFSTTS